MQRLSPLVPNPLAIKVLDSLFSQGSKNLVGGLVCTSRGSSQDGRWPPPGANGPFSSGKYMGAGRGDSQVEKAAFSGLGRNVGRFFPLP